MNKVITIRLGHYVLTIDEDAANKVGFYTEALRKKYANDSSAAEIVSDIEERIGELLERKQKENQRNFNTLQDVEEVIAQMGPLETGQGADSGFHSDQQRRLFRDPENRIIGGVCGGIGAYFDMDPVILRVILVLLMFLFGFGIPLYIVLWVVMPEARTTAEKLMMRGQKPTLQNIEDNIKSEFQDVKKRFRYSQNQDRFTSFFGSLFRYFALAIAWVASTAFSIIAGILLLSLVCVLIAVFTDSIYFHNQNTVINGQEGLNVLLSAGGNPLYLKIGIIVLILLLISVAALNVFTGKEYRNRTRIPRRYITWASVVVFLILFVFTFQGFRSISQENEKISYSEIIPVTGDTLILDATIINTDKPGFYTLNSFVDVVASDNQNYRIEQRNIAFGYNRISSSMRLENAPKAFRTEGNSITLDQGKQIRSLQENGLGWIKYTLYVPKGKSVKTGSNFHFPENNYTPLFNKNMTLTMDSTGNTISSGSGAEQIPLGTYVKNLTVHGNINIQIIRSTSNRLELVSGPITGHRDWIDLDDESVIIGKDIPFYQENPSFVRLYVKNLNRLETNGISKARFKNWEAQDLEIESNGASSVEGSINADNLRLDLEGASKMRISGNCDHMDLETSGATEFSGESMAANRARVSCSGSSHISIFVKDELEGEASGASSIELKGHPRESNVETSGAAGFKRI